MLDKETLQRQFNQHFKEAERAYSVNDYLLAYQNFHTAYEEAKQLAELELDKSKAEALLVLGEECNNKAQNNLSLLKLPPEEEAKIRARKPVKGFDEFVGLEEIKAYLKEDIVTPWKNHEMYLRKKDNLFLYGPDGVGKTTLVQSLIHELDATSYFIEPFRNFSIYSYPNIEQHIKEMFRMAEEKDNVVFYFEHPGAFFPKSNDSKVLKKTAKIFLKFVAKETKRVRKLKKNILFIAGTPIPDKIAKEAFGKYLFNDFVRIHHLNHQGREVMIKERLGDIQFEDENAILEIVDYSHHFLTTELSRLCRQFRKVATRHLKDNDNKLLITKEQQKLILDDFKTEDDVEFLHHVDEFEASLPKGTEIHHC